jgi:hypothetical protein
MNKIKLGMQALLCVTLAALLMAPTAAADCVTECDANKMGACAAGSASGAGSAGGAGVICMGNINIVIAVLIVGDVNQCSAIVHSNATSCEGDPENGFEIMTP